MARRKQNAKKTVKLEKEIPVGLDEDPKLYARLEAVVQRHHKTQLGDARIVIVWVRDVKADREGLVKYWWVELLTKAKKHLAGFDIMLKLNEATFKALPTCQDAILDEALCAVVPVHRRDTRDRPLFLTRKPRIQVFPENCRRHGLWQAEANTFVLEMRDRAHEDGQGALPGFEDASRPKPEPRETGIPTEAAKAIEKGVGRDAHRGWKLAGPAKVGKAVTPEVARAEIDRFFALVDAGNRSAATMIQRKLEQGGWRAPELDAPAAREPAMAIAAADGLAREYRGAAHEAAANAAERELEQW